ncbi:cytoplasmic protein required for cell viability [Sporothrix schenckii 1099-18]|uniref:MIP18 family-like domain-containing protein n=2 Tax=Sporothrix schenckii TaxID=29908 RepID=U7Q3M8_SPOS1|nr:cytoplasmic protein required for cell viability [Sporothrix schenckii 1099-18]ERT01802.1 hypothetical protein HMPREF1624_00096 [Sporothrix schenckii ATCC 58251]KJR81064.1 cytoplasmic protein required for cell viability [Sporothrix schenckii 1099-18]
MAELQNANPVILNAAQLPSRRLGKDTASTRGPEFKFDDILAPKTKSASGAASSWAAPAVAPPSPLSSVSSGDAYDDVEAFGGDDGDVFTEEPIDEQEIYDPEHPHTLGQLSVVNLPDIRITPSPTSAEAKAAANDPNALTQVLVYVTPTINHCSLVTVIGLAIRVRLEQTLPPNYRVDIQVKEGAHAQDDQVTKQLSDKERVAAALENDTLRGVLDKMLETCQ